MKTIKTLITTLTVAALLTVLPQGNALKAEAAEPKNFAVKYCPDQGNGEWRYQEGSVFNDEAADRELYYLMQDIKAGDKVAVYNDTSDAPALDLGSVKLGDLTICRTAMTVVYTGGISTCHVLSGSTCSVNGEIDYAYVYDVATVTFTGSVTELTATAENEEFNSNIGCNGQVWHLNAYSINAPKTFYNLYNFDKDTLVIEDGNLKTEYYHYDESTVGNPAPAQNTSGTAAATPTPAAPAAGSSNEYDDVPKTGESNLIFWFLAASALCLAGSLALNKKAN